MRLQWIANAFTLLMVLSLVPGCTTSSRTGKLVPRDSARTLATSPPLPGKAAIVFSREAKIMGSAGLLRVRSGGEVLVDVPNGTTVRFELAPGRHNLSMSWLDFLGEHPASPEFDLALFLESGKVRYISGNTTDGGLVEISPERASDLILKNEVRNLDTSDSR